MNPSTAQARVVVDELIRGGVRDVVLCPGSRNAPLAFALLLLGVEHMRFSPGISVMNPMDLYHMPFTHSLLGAAVFGALFGGLVLAFTRSRAAAGIAVACVLSHRFVGRNRAIHWPGSALWWCGR